MTPIEIINLLLGVGFITLGWFARELWSAVKQLKEDLIKLKDDVNASFTRKDDFREFRREVLDVLNRIEGKLDTKQDKA